MGGLSGRGRSGRLAAFLALVAALVAPGGAAAAGPAFGTPTATATFGSGVDFRQPVTDAAAVRRAELLLDYPMAPGPQVFVVPTPAAGSGTLRYALDTSTGGLLPNTTLTARWRLVHQDGSAVVGPSVTVRYDDSRFAWQTRTGSVVRVHWTQGGAAFGDRALQVGEDAVARTSRLLGVTEREPIDFFVYADQAAFYDALGPGTRENVGGEAIAELRTLFALITPSEINASWVNVVIPHELSHLVFDTAVRNPYHFPPRWLNEGLAVYLSQGYGSSDRAAVAAAVAAGTLMPLSALASQFPTTRERFSLAYAESVAAVDFLVREKGEAALVALIRSYAGGVTDDDAFRAAIGLDVAAVDAAWRGSVGARDPVPYGPAPAPTGPLPEDWLGAAGGALHTNPRETLAVAPSVATSPAAPAPVAPAGDGTGWLVAALGAVLLALGVGLALVRLAIRAERRSDARGASGVGHRDDPAAGPGTNGGRP